VRADHLLPFARAQLAEQGQGLIVAHGQDLGHGESTGCGLLQEV